MTCKPLQVSPPKTRPNPTTPLGWGGRFHVDLAGRDLKAAAAIAYAGTTYIGRPLGDALIGWTEAGQTGGMLLVMPAPDEDWPPAILDAYTTRVLATLRQRCPACGSAEMRSQAVAWSDASPTLDRRPDGTADTLSRPLALERYNTHSPALPPLSGRPDHAPGRGSAPLLEGAVMCSLRGPAPSGPVHAARRNGDPAGRAHLR